jgi:hypothetical protein
MAGAEAIRWAPRVSRELIRRLYETDARGIVDEELIDEVAFAFLARCESILKATEAHLGRAACPVCGRTVEHQHRSASLLRCSGCGWAATWAEYRRSYQGKYLITGNPGGAFTEYMRRVKAAATAREKMLAIDWMVHQVHSWTQEKQTPVGRPAAINLIEGTETKVMAFLDSLANERWPSEEARQTHEAWRGRLYLDSERPKT